MKLQDFSQFLLIGQQSVKILFAEPAESLVRRSQEGQFSGACDALHKIGGKIFHDAVELVKDAVALFLAKKWGKKTINRFARIKTGETMTTLSIAIIQYGL